MGSGYPVPTQTSNLILPIDDSQVCNFHFQIPFYSIVNCKTIKWQIIKWHHLRLKEDIN